MGRGLKPDPTLRRDGEKFCRKCSTWQPADLIHFYANHKSPDKLGYQCKDCYKLYKPSPRTREKNKALRLKTQFNMTQADYDRLLELQDGVCAICNNPERAKGRQLAVDHDHATGKVRGLLCMMCNTGLGKLGDNIEGIQSALDYLQKCN